MFGGFASLVCGFVGLSVSGVCVLRQWVLWVYGFVAARVCVCVCGLLVFVFVRVCFCICVCVCLC